MQSLAGCEMSDNIWVYNCALSLSFFTQLFLSLFFRFAPKCPHHGSDWNWKWALCSICRIQSDKTTKTQPKPESSLGEVRSANLSPLKIVFLHVFLKSQNKRHTHTITSRLLHCNVCLAETWSNLYVPLLASRRCIALQHYASHAKKMHVCDLDQGPFCIYQSVK